MALGKQKNPTEVEPKTESGHDNSSGVAAEIKLAAPAAAASHDVLAHARDAMVEAGMIKHETDEVQGEATPSNGESPITGHETRAANGPIGEDPLKPMYVLALDKKPVDVVLTPMEGMRRGFEWVSDRLSDFMDWTGGSPVAFFGWLAASGYLAYSFVAPFLAPFVAGTIVEGTSALILSLFATFVGVPVAIAVGLLALGAAGGALWGYLRRGKKLKN
ncbi:MAG: hypothetical protein AAB573_01625 [Patescibacteria group bacterium]